jgi:hypothetical protein
MMRIATLLVLLVALQISGLAAAQAQKGFDVKGWSLFNVQRGDKGRFGVDQSCRAAIKALGLPTKRGKEYFEIDEDTATVLYYHANRLYFLKDALVRFELNDNMLTFGPSFKQAFRVGAPLTIEIKKDGPGPPVASPRYLIEATPLKYLKVVEKPGKSRNIRYSLIAYNHLRYGDEKYDGWFEILFDGNRKVINIAMGE